MDATLSDRLSAHAHRLLDDEGPAALSVRRLAAAADVAPMSIYNHFGSKDGVVDRVVMEGFADLQVQLLALPRSQDPLADLRTGTSRYRELALARPHLYAVMFERAVPGFEPSAECWRVAIGSFQVLVDLVGQAQERGVLRDGPTVALAEQLWATIHGLVTLELHGLGFAPDPEQHYRATVDTMLRGMAAEHL